ncbi:hypothetical protein B0H10DRAFT_700520 [Mycena sp. CBHHK59/15]|nr:hypothetical protein B0H10DRAFT_700520 [Mycena sp. CBHHK59/15]
MAWGVPQIQLLYIINEDHEVYTAVEHSPQLPLLPPNSDRWSVLVDSILVDRYPIELKFIVPSAPAGNIVAVLDSATPTAVVPKAISDGIYPRVPGATFDKRMACGLFPARTIVLGGQQYNIHPLDLTDVSVMSVGGQARTVCTSTFNPASGSNSFEYDAMLAIR